MGLPFGLFAIYFACQLLGAAWAHYGFLPVTIAILVVLQVLTAISRRSQNDIRL